MIGKFTTLLVAAAVIVLLGGSIPAHAQRDFDRHFAMKAAQGNVAEVMTSRLALKKSRSRYVRMTADRLIKEHSMANAQLKQIARKKGMQLPNMPDPMQKAVYNRLARLSGANFDRAFLAAQIRAHLNAISLHQNEVRVGKDADLNVYAREVLPRIQDHTTMIVSLAQSSGVRIPPAASQYQKVQTSSGMKM